MAPQALLIISGAWHVPGHYQKMTDLLEAKGIRTIVPTLPTNNGIVPPNTTFYDDVELIQEIVAREVEAGTHLTVMAHSYGGCVATAALGRYALTDASKGGVNHICYLSSFLPKEGQSLVGVFDGYVPPFITDGPEGTAICADPEGHLWHDLTQGEQEDARRLLTPFQWDAQFCKSDRKVPAAWRKIPVSYVICENDFMLPAAYQQMIIDTVTAEGVEVREFRVPSSHSPFLSKPYRMVNIMREIMKDVDVPSVEVETVPIKSVVVEELTVKHIDSKPATLSVTVAEITEQIEV